MPGAVRRAAIAFAVGAVVMAGFAAVALSRSPPRLLRIGAPGVKALGPQGANLIGSTTHAARICQGGEVLPAGATAIRVSVWAFFGAPVHLSVFRGNRSLTAGSRNANWTSSSVTVPVKPVPHAVTGAKVCVTLAPNDEPLSILGAHVPAQEAAVMSAPTHGSHTGFGNGHRLFGRLTLEYLASGSGSWWSRALSVARHLGLGRAFSGTWIAVLLALLVGAVGVLSVGLSLRELR